MTLIMALLWPVAFAEDLESANLCAKYPLFVEGAKHTYRSLDEKGKLTQILLETSHEVQPMMGGMQARIQTIIQDKNGKETDSRTSTVQCLNGTLSYLHDISITPVMGVSLLEKLDRTATRTALVYPPAPRVGQALKDSYATITTTHQDHPERQSTMTFAKRDRRVVGHERLATPAGEFDSYKLAYLLDLSTTGMDPADDFADQVVEWYVPGFGVIRRETTHDGKRAITELIEAPAL